MSKIILDSNTYSRLLKADKKVEVELEKAKNVYFSIIVLGELLAGFKKGDRQSYNKGLLEKFLNKDEVEILDANQDTADIYADIKYFLEKKGVPIPTNDIWIAAHAKEKGARLITYDKHFLKIPGLRVWDELK